MRSVNDLGIPLAVAARKDFTNAYRLADQVTAECIAIDDCLLGFTKTHHRAWDWLKEGDSEWSVVLDDEAVPIPDFRRKLNLALLQAPSPIVSLYYPSDDHSEELHWVTSLHLWDCLGLAVKTILIPSMMEWIVDMEPLELAIAQWAQQNHFEISYVRPSLVERKEL
jgi:hypothetical protein